MSGRSRHPRPWPGSGCPGRRSVVRDRDLLATGRHLDVLIRRRRVLHVYTPSSAIYSGVRRPASSPQASSSADGCGLERGRRSGGRRSSPESLVSSRLARDRHPRTRCTGVGELRPVEGRRGGSALVEQVDAADFAYQKILQGSRGPSRSPSRSSPARCATRSATRTCCAGSPTPSRTSRRSDWTRSGAAEQFIEVVGGERSPDAFAWRCIRCCQTGHGRREGTCL